MADQIVSIRVPSSLVDELKDLARDQHFMDVSELIRSLLREQWNQHKDPYSLKLAAIKEGLSKKELPEKIESLKRELKKLLEDINELS